MDPQERVARAMMGNVPTGSLRAYEPSLRERVGNFIYDKAGLMGLGAQAQRMRNEGTAIADFVPGVGDALAVDEAADAYRGGRYGEAALAGGLAALGLVPGAGDVAAKGVKKGIRAFHGSPHDFDQFDIAKAGSGSGLDRGNGVYLTEDRHLAEHYRPRDGRVYEVDIAGAESFADLDGAPPKEIMDLVPLDDPASVQWSKLTMDGGGDGWYGESGRHYASVMPVNDGGFAAFVDQNHIGDFPNADEAKQAAAIGAVSAPHRTTGDAYRTLTDRLGGKGNASEALRSAGVKGVSYLQPDRMTGAGAKNFVVFDPGVLEIVKKYGLAGAVSAGLISQQMADDMASQGIGEGA